MAGIDASTKLMLHMNGTDGSTTFTDDSDSVHSITTNGVAEIDTAQSVFGGASGLIGGGFFSQGYLSLSDSTDFAFGSGNWTIDFRVRFNVLSGTTELYNQFASSNKAMRLQFSQPVSLLTLQYTTDGSTNKTISETWSPSTGIWYHVAIVRDGTTVKMFIDGIQLGSGGAISTDSIFDSTANINIGTDETAGDNFINGWLDEYRISNTARWTTNFTPPTSEYTSDSITVSTNTLNINSNIISNTIQIDCIHLPNTLNITSNIQNPANVGDLIVIDSNTLSIGSNIESPNIIIDTTVTPNTLNITSDIKTPVFPVTGSLIAKIISVNPLIAVTSTNPSKIIKIDTTDPQNLVFTSATLTGLGIARDVSYNSGNQSVFITGDAGLVMEVEIADITNQTLFDLNDTDNITTVENNTNFGLTYLGTDNAVGELYVLDNRLNFKLDSDFQLLQPFELKIDSYFSAIELFRMDTNFHALAQQTFSMNSDFKCIIQTTSVVFPPSPPDPSPPPPPSPITNIDDIEPIKLTDFQVFVGGTELLDPDLILDSISITHTVGQKSTASFRLSRRHDELDVTLQGVSIPITGQPTLEIKIKGVTDFNGNIGQIEGRYNTTNEFVQVTAFANEKPERLQEITMSLPSKNKRLHLYDILVQNPRIFDPFVDPNDDNPKKFKGVRVNLGKKIEQSNLRLNIFDESGSIADQISDGSINLFHNSTYFWSPTAFKLPLPTVQIQPGANFKETTEEEDKVAQFDAEQRKLPLNQRKPWLKFAVRVQQEIDRKREKEQAILISQGSNVKIKKRSLDLKAKRYLYIGTSLAPVSEDLWTLELAQHHRQTIHQDVETDLGTFEIGEAPFKEINIRNGIKIAKPHLVDETDGLYSIKDAEFNFTEFGKLVANLEYKKLQNRNDQILPETSCSINMTVDAYLFYQISLLTLIKIDNTTTSDIYTTNNGFPVSAKSITITSSDRKATVQADNLRSEKELDIINRQFPNDENDEYNIPKRRILISTKVDMRTNLRIVSDEIKEDNPLFFDSKGNPAS